jgi:hypothetical protein
VYEEPNNFFHNDIALSSFLTREFSSKAIEDSLNSYYKSAIASWKVDILPGTVEVTSITSEGFKTQGSGLFARYTSDMKRSLKLLRSSMGN